jgi:hypothetical protein
MHRILAMGLASLPTVCSGTSTSVQVIDLTDAASDDGGSIVDGSFSDGGWLGAACDPANPSTCDEGVGLTCATVHTNLPEDLYATCVFSCGTSIEVSQCAAWGGKCAGGPESGAGFPAFGYCVLDDF